MPLKWTTRKSTIHCPPSRFQVIPDCFSRCVNTVLHAASSHPAADRQVVATDSQ